MKAKVLAFLNDHRHAIRLGVVYAMAIIAIVLIPKLYNHGQRNAGARAERTSVAKAADKAAADTIVVVQIKYVHDTIRLTKSIQKWDTVYAEHRITDTVWVKQALASAQETITSCSLVVADCGKLNALKDIRIKSLETELKNVPQPPGLIARARSAGLWAAAGFGACKLTAIVGVL